MDTAENIEKKFKFPKEKGIEWLKALRSGKYIQSNGYLVDNKGGHCCLGVLGKVCGLTTDDIAGKRWLIDYPNIPEEVIGGANINEFVEEVSTMNDTGYTFEQIADYIENNVEFY